MSRFIILFIRYVVAIAVSWFASFATFGLAMSIAGSLLPMHPNAGEYAFYFGLAVVGFCGVFLGALCLERASRRVGAIILLVLGLVYYVYLAYPITLSFGPDAKDPHYFYRWLLPLSVGGLLSVSFVFWIFRHQPPNTALEPTPTAP